MTKWHIFIILIVSCISTIVAPSNLIIIVSVSMEVYNSSLKFQIDCIYMSQDMAFYILHCDEQGLYSTTQMYGKTMIL